ncbi:MAG: crossover junction endodeoxyribonuclease RuvC [Dehalococcoidia bacterium]|nr:crossover junction endodeoxyribonuclease RuvC [Dehalococcoidia bacterium]
MVRPPMVRLGRTALIVLGIDPGLRVTGYGLVRAEGDRYQALGFGVVAPPAAAPRAERLLRIHEALCDVIREARPDEVAVEDFIVGYVRAAVAVGEARAVALLAAALAGLPVSLYKPLEVKQFVTSYGRGSKEQVAMMVQALLGLPEPPQPADAADALAVALCHHLRRGSPLTATHGGSGFSPAAPGAARRLPISNLQPPASTAEPSP